MAPEIKNTNSEHILQCMDRHFLLSIDLRVECGTKRQFRSHGLLKTRLELISEPAVPVGYYCHWHSMFPTISRIYILVILFKGSVILMANKWENLVSRSIITQITSCLERPLGNHVTKSIVMCSNFYSGIDNGWNSALVRWYSTLTCWHTRHLETKSATSFFIPFYQNRGHILWYILMLLGCIANFEL